MIENTKTEILDWSTKELLYKILTSPRQFFNYINKNRYEKYYLLLIILSGISSGFGIASMRNLGDKTSLISIILACIFVGGIIGWIGLYIFSGLVSWTGDFLKGTSSTQAVFRIFVYAKIPSIICLILIIPQISIYGVEIYKADGDIFSAGTSSNIIVYGCMILEFFFEIYTIVLSVIGLSEIQKFSIWKSILNIFLPIFIFFIIAFVLILLFRLF